MTTSIIVAIARNRAIGAGGDMVYHIGPDLKRFKALTMGKPLIMGRRTFESLPGGALPGRRNIVVTRNAGFSAPDTERAGSLEEALAICDGASEVMIIGGGEIYRQAMPLADRLYITHIDDSPEDADTFFPEIDPGQWAVAKSDGPYRDPRSGLSYTFTDYCRL